MLKSVIAGSLRQAVLVVVAALLMIGGGIVALDRMAVDVFPELNAPSVTMITETGGLSAEETEQFVTFPLESAVNGLPGLRRVRSQSTLGLSIVYADFEWGVDIYRARQMIAERLDWVRDELPAGAHLQMTPITSITGEIMLVGLRASDEQSAASPQALRAHAEFTLRNRLLAVPGIAQVVAIGGALPEYQVLLRQEDLQLYGVTGAEVAAAVAGSHNLDAAGFLVDIGGRELPLIQGGRVTGVEDIAATVIELRDGSPITVEDVADVQLGGAIRRGAAAIDGVPGVILAITKSPGTNTLALTERVDDALDEAAAVLPPGMVLEPEVFRQADFIQRSVDNVIQVLIEASVIVSLILILFLMNLRTTVITLCALPVSLGVTLLVLWAAGMGLNVMTLGGLAVAIGILVDDAIIDVENVHRRLREDERRPPEQRRSRLQVIFDASNEIRSSIMFATLIIVIVFVPLLFLQGLEGRFFRPLAITYMVAIGTSLVVAMTLTPALCRLLLRGRLGTERGDSRLVDWLKRGYRPLLAACLRLRALTLGGAGVLCTGALWLATTFGTSFLPDFNEGTLTVFLTMPPGTALAESERVSLGVQQRLLELPGVAHVASRSGRAERDEHAEPPSNSELDVGLAPGADAEAVRSSLAALDAELPGVDVSVGQPISHRLSHVLSGTRAEIAIDLYHDDLAVLRELARTVEERVDAMSETGDVLRPPQVRIRTLAIDYRHADLARYGLTPAGAGRQVQRALRGETVGQVNRGTERIDLVLRLREVDRDQVADVRDLLLIGGDGALVRLHEVADVHPQLSANVISRHNARRKAVVAVNVAPGHDLGSTVAAIRAEVDGLAAAVGAEAVYGGQFEAQRSATRSLLWLGIAVGVVMLLLLQIALGGLRPALVVLVNVPLAVIGGVVAMWLTAGRGGGGAVVTIASLVGFITLFGIAVRNGILLVNHYRHLRSVDGLGIEDAIRQGSEERLVPVLMTALSAALGLLPLALKAGQPGSELLAPLAIVVLGGLVTSTLLNMVVVPVIYRLLCTAPPREPDPGL